MYGPNKEVPDYHNSEIRDLLSAGYSAEHIYNELFRRGFMEGTRRRRSIEQVKGEGPGISHYG